MQANPKETNLVTWSQLKVALGKARRGGLRVHMHDGRVAVIQRLSSPKVKPVAALFADRLGETLNKKWGETRKARSCVITAKTKKERIQAVFLDYAQPFNLSNESKLEEVVRETIQHNIEATLRFTMLVVYRNRVYERNPLTIENGIVKPVKGQMSQIILDALLKNQDPNIEALLSV